MKKQVLALSASAVIFAFGALGPVAQAQGPATPGSQQRPAGNQGGDSTMRGGGMMGGGMMGRKGMMREGMMGQGQAGGMAPMMMRMMFSLMDSNSDGKLSLEEVQTAHERIFKSMDANKDGFVTLEEMQEFMHGTSNQTPQQ